MKRCLKILIAVLSLTLLFIFSVDAENNIIKEIEISNFTELKNALENQNDNGRLTLVLQNDISEDSSASVVFDVQYPNDLTIDLNGYNLSVASKLSSVLFRLSSAVNFSVINSESEESEINFNTSSNEISYMFLFENKSAKCSFYGDVAVNMNTSSAYIEVGGEYSYIFCCEFLDSLILNGTKVTSYAYNPVIISAVNSGLNMSDLSILGNAVLYNGSFSRTSPTVEIDSSVIETINFKTMNIINEYTVNTVSLNDIANNSKPIAYFENLAASDFSTFSFGNISSNMVFGNGYIYKNVTVKGDIALVFNCNHDESVAKVFCSLGHIMVCKNCGEYIGIEAHNEKVLVPATAASCTTDGLSESRVCSNENCGYEICASQVLKATGHSAVTDEATSATCTKSGLTKGSHCAACGEVLLQQKTISALGHIVDEETITETSATCTSKGTKMGCCSRCKATITTKTNALGHNFTQKVIDDAHLVYAPTYTYGGEYYYDCTRCSAKSSNTFIADNKLTLGTTNKLTATQTTNSIKLSWSKVKDATGYRVYQKVDGAWKKIASTTAVTYNVTNLKAGTKYYFYVIAYIKENGKTIWSTGKTNITTATQPETPAKTSATQSVSTVKLSWSASSGATGYRVYKYNSNTKKYEAIAWVKGATTYKISKLNSGTVYYFKIKPYIKLSNGEFVWGSFTNKIQTATKPSVPKLSVKSLSKGSAILSWTNVSGESGYQVYYCKTKNGTYKKLETYAANTTLKKLTSLESGKTYYFKVRAYKKVAGTTIYGGFSDVKSVKIK